MAGSSIKYRISVAPDLPLCEYDENQVAQVFQNLVINAREAMSETGKIEIRLDAVDGGDVGSGSGDQSAHPRFGSFIRVSVSDQGPGMEKEDLERVFDAFFTTKESGSSLGLAISHSIVNKHDGVIEIESVAGKGTTVQVLLPATDKRLPVTEPDEVALIRPGCAALVMDDEACVSQVLTSILQRLGMKVTVADSGGQALDLVRRAQQEGAGFDIAFLDLTVPDGMGGREAVEEIHRLAPSLPCVAISGYSEDSALVAPRKYGFASALKKPFLLKDVERIVAATLI